MMTKRWMYRVQITPDQVHDGDTIEDISVVLCKYDWKGEEQEIWPNLYLTKEGLVCRFSLRLYGIDAPEMHPHHVTTEGVVRTQRSLNKEKKLAEKSRQGLIDYLAKYDNTIYIQDAFDGKYAGRYVCAIYVKAENGTPLSVADYMCCKGFAKPYFGGKKESWA